jgi:hypothetical protein
LSNLEKLEDLKRKYNISEEDMAELESKLAESRSLDLPLSGSDDLGTSIRQALKEGSSLSEIFPYIFLMDWMESRRERLEAKLESRKVAPPTDLSETIQKLTEQWEKQRQEDRAYFEKLILGEKIQSATRENEELRKELKERNEREARMREQDEMKEYVNKTVESVRNMVSQLPREQQKGFFEEIFAELGNDLKEDLKNQLIKRLKGESEEEIITTDEKGKTKADLIKIGNRLLRLGEKYIERMSPPLRREVQAIPQIQITQEEYNRLNEQEKEQIEPFILNHPSETTPPPKIVGAEPKTKIAEELEIQPQETQSS